MRRPVLDKLALVHHNDFVEVEDGVELVRNSDERVVREFVAEQLLDVRVCGVVETDIY